MDNLNISSLPLPPGKSGLPFIGETIEFLRSPNFAKERHKEYGDIFLSHILGRPAIFIIGAEANKFLFTNEKSYFHSTWPASTKKLLGSASLPVQQGEEHKKRRQILAKAFQPRALDSYINTIESISDEYFNHWEKLNKFTWYPEIKNYTLDIACKLFVGIEHASRSQLGQYYETWVNGLFTLNINLPWTKFGKAWKNRKLLLAEIETIIQNRKQQDNFDSDALGLLINAEDEDGNRLSMEELKEQILALIFAGHETLTSALVSFCLLMSKHPEVLEKAYTEQQEIGLATPLTLENLQKMTYLERVLQETLRFIPPVSGGFREVIKSCEFKGYQIPQGYSILYQIGFTHQDNQIYSNPEKFDPHRFSPERAEDKSKMFSYIPFAGGMRECIGKEFAKLEMKIFATLLIRNFRWQLLPEQNLDYIMVPTPRPQGGLKVEFMRNS